MSLMIKRTPHMFQAHLGSFWLFSTARYSRIVRALLTNVSVLYGRVFRVRLSDSALTTSVRI